MAGSKTGMIYALGELLIDMIPTQTDMLIRDPGTVLKTASGSAGIFACAAQLLGGNAGFVGKVGRDSLSLMVVQTMRDQGVDLSNVVVSDEGQIGLAFLEYAPDGRHYQYYRSHSVGSMLSSADIDESKLENAWAIHYPGMLLELTDEMRGACEHAADIAHRRGALVSFDPNIRKEITADNGAKERLLHAVGTADITAPTLQEGRMITGRESIPDVLKALHDMGPRTVALTMDKDGAVISRAGEIAVAEGIDIYAVDPTGAGDTLAAALCVGLREEMPIERLAAFCNCAGTLTTSRRGAIGMALPTREETERLMKSEACRVRVMTAAEFDRKG